MHQLQQNLPYVLVQMADICIDDVVDAVDRETGEFVSSRVYMVPHRVESGLFEFLSMKTASGHTLTLTADHLLFTAPGLHSSFSSRKALRADAVRLGDYVWVMEPDQTTLAITTVLSISSVWETGLMAPFTETGTLIVNGVVTSTYGGYGMSDSQMHALCKSLLHRLLCIAPYLVKLLQPSHQGSPILLALGNYISQSTNKFGPGLVLHLFKGLADMVSV